MSVTEQLILTFISGGIICVIAQLLIDLTKLTPARILVCYVSAGVLLYAVGVYTPLFEIFGAGVSVPLIGFGANIGRGVMEAVEKEGLIGALSGGLSASASGISAALILGLLASLIFKTRSKRM
jgi:stage V sporulation protein AE